MSARVVIAGALAVGVAVVVASSPLAAPDQRAPRIVRAVMQDADGDGLADRVRLTYSERVRHRADRDGSYPFRVSGYRVRSVGRAGGRSVVVMLVEQDGAAQPSVRYRRTGADPVADRAGNQARGQTFAGTQPFGPGPTDPVTPDPTNPQVDPTPVDRDGDGTVNGQDCAPDDPARHPKAPDLPDPAFVDANCDGIDGTERNAIFVSPQGKDTNPGTKTAPKRQIQAAVVAAAASGKDVYAAAGSYGRVVVATGVGIYGGYDPKTWKRIPSRETSIIGAPEAIYADGDTGVVLQQLDVQGVTGGHTLPGSSAYGIRAVNGSVLTLARVDVSAGAGVDGAAGADGARGVRGEPGSIGIRGICDTGSFIPPSVRIPGGSGAFGRNGGDGGPGGVTDIEGGVDGEPGTIGTPGGEGGAYGNPGKSGHPGQPGRPGLPGTPGEGGSSSAAAAAQTWRGTDGSSGRSGTAGMGGGGGGGGGGQTGYFVLDGRGNDGGGGGGAGGPGEPGAGGGFGGGSFGVYLYNSTLTADGGSIQAGAGGDGGAGGRGGPGGLGGQGALGRAVCTDEVGAGGDGGDGGPGGPSGGGGGGAGGPSVGVMKVGASTATLTGVEIRIGAPGAGGATGTGGSGSSPPAQSGVALPVSGP